MVVVARAGGGEKVDGGREAREVELRGAVFETEENIELRSIPSELVEL